jgi:hypothetical protein
MDDCAIPILNPKIFSFGDKKKRKMVDDVVDDDNEVIGLYNKKALLYRGPRKGTYYYNSNKNKQYVKLEVDKRISLF